jgi:hypothetical protein
MDATGCWTLDAGRSMARLLPRSALAAISIHVGKHLSPLAAKNASVSASASSKLADLAARLCCVSSFLYFSCKLYKRLSQGNLLRHRFSTPALLPSSSATSSCKPRGLPFQCPSGSGWSCTSVGGAPFMLIVTPTPQLRLINSCAKSDARRSWT